MYTRHLHRQKLLCQNFEPGTRVEMPKSQLYCQLIKERYEEEEEEEEEADLFTTDLVLAKHCRLAHRSQT